MPPGLPPHIHVAILPTGAIVLDLAADRYRRLQPVQARLMERLADRVPLEGDVARAAEDALRAGLLTDDSGARRPSRKLIDVPQSSALEDDGPGEPISRPQLCWSLAAARLRLRFTGLHATLTFLVHHSRGGEAPSEHAGALARGFVRERAACPLFHACLPDAIALHRLLSQQGLRARLVLGVRDGPFAAHAWVQTTDAILSDTLDPVRELTPIFVL